MGLQIIFCVEANSKSKSDYIYIKSVIEHFYIVDQANMKLSTVYMDGKGKYASPKVQGNVNEKIKQYKNAAKNNKSVVVFCFDCDEYDNRPEDRSFLEEARRFCEQNGYRFVWFCKDIESVFVGKRVTSGMKAKTAAAFASKRQIRKVEISNLRAHEYHERRSNLCCVLEDYLEQKA